MSLTKLVKEMEQQGIKNRKEERRILESIAERSDWKTAETAAELYAPEKHGYSFAGYLHQLSKLEELLGAGIPDSVALGAVDTCLDTETIIKAYKGGLKNAHNIHH